MDEVADPAEGADVDPEFEVDPEFDVDVLPASDDEAAAGFSEPPLGSAEFAAGFELPFPA